MTATMLVAIDSEATSVSITSAGSVPATVDPTSSSNGCQFPPLPEVLPDIDGHISILHTALILNAMHETGNPGCDTGNVSPTPAQQAQAARLAAELAARLADVNFALPGTLADRLTRCGHPGCRCRADPPRLHGLNHQWTRKKNGKTATRILSDDQLADYGPWFDNHQRLRELI